jgi:hypothetical protein
MDAESKDFSFDIIGIFLTLWKRKLIIIPGVLLCMVLSGLYFMTRPYNHASTVTVKIGKVAHIKIESYPDIMIYLNSMIAARPVDGVSISAVVSRQNLNPPEDLYGTLLLDITASSDSSEKSTAAVESFAKPIIERHNTLFIDALQSLKKNGPNLYSERGALLFIDSYTFPTQLYGSIVKTRQKEGVRGGWDGWDGSKGLLLYIFIAGVFAFMLLSCVVTAYDFITVELKKRAGRQN